jgi:hypothetical protein
MPALHRLVYLDGTDLERRSEAFMRFRLTYAGPLLSSNPSVAEDSSNADEAAKRAARIARRLEHKHCLRRHFHKQLKELWQTNKFLSNKILVPRASSLILPEGAASVFLGDDLNTKYRMDTVLARCYGHHTYGFVPLVRKEISLACSLRVLCLRRDGPGAVSASRDIDNRVKTLIDALTMPSYEQGFPLKDGVPTLPTDEETPHFYVLLSDDRLVTHLEVETDTALEVSEAEAADESFVRLLISVEIRPYDVSTFNLEFA